ncbi:MAG: class I SAM-dependent methyltransferase [Anaerolineaceae bacterium]
MSGTSSEPLNAPAGEQSDRFEFGKNWQRFLLRLNEERILEAESSLMKMLQVNTLKGLTFLDIGCGSGLFSLAAMRLGAEKVLSFDYDPQCVACTHDLKQKYFPGNDSWKMMQGSVLDDDLIKSLGQWDIVYCRGVLHHTGRMWKGLSNTMLAVRNQGKLFIAIYNDQGNISRIWAWIKKTYNQMPSSLRFLILIPSFVRLWGPTLIKDLFKGRPLKSWRNYIQKRGMSPWDDVIDWVGGYPYEVAKSEEIFRYCHKQGFQLIELITTDHSGCNEFVFVRKN